MKTIIEYMRREYDNRDRLLDMKVDLEWRELHDEECPIEGRSCRDVLDELNVYLGY